MSNKENVLSDELKAKLTNFMDFFKESKQGMIDKFFNESRKSLKSAKNPKWTDFEKYMFTLVRLNIDVYTGKNAHINGLMYDGLFLDSWLENEYNLTTEDQNKLNITSALDKLAIHLIKLARDQGKLKLYKLV